MTKNPDMERVKFLSNVLGREFKHLMYSDGKIFEVVNQENIEEIMQDELFAEHVEAFASRFARFQDTIGDKLLPVWLRLLEEKPAPLIDNLNNAEKLGILPSAENWVTIRKLRNQLVHEYIEDYQFLFDALIMAHKNISFLELVMNNILVDCRNRGYL
jgi:hypothetical protein